MILDPRTRFLLIGDSITDAMRQRPGREGSDSGPLGSGYVALVQQFFSAFHPAHRIEVLNRGVGGNTVADLASRWSSDVLDERPDALGIMIGINDVWRQFDKPFLPADRRIGMTNSRTPSTRSSPAPENSLPCAT